MHAARIATVSEPRYLLDISALLTLIEEDAILISEFTIVNHSALSHKSYYNAFLDFYCQGCYIPIRVYYSIEEMAGSRRKVFDCDILFVVEGTSR